MPNDPQTAKTCATCQHWNSERYEDYDGAGGLDVHECKVVDPYWKAQEYAGDDYEKKQLTESGRTRLAFAQDGSGYMAKLLTKAEFGCNMWEMRS